MRLAAHLLCLAPTLFGVTLRLRLCALGLTLRTFHITLCVALCAFRLALPFCARTLGLALGALNLARHLPLYLLFRRPVSVVVRRRQLARHGA